MFFNYFYKEDKNDTFKFNIKDALIKLPNEI